MKDQLIYLILMEQFDGRIQVEVSLIHLINKCALRRYFFLPSPDHLQASEEKPEAIVVPVAILGEVSEIRRKILQNTLNEI